MLNLNSSLPEGWTANIVIIYQSSNIYWRGAPVYTSPAPDLQHEQAAPERVCGLRNAGFEPESGLRRGRRGANGIENPKIEPGRPAERAQGIKNGNLDPRRGLRMGCRGVLGIENADFEPGRPAGRALGIRMTDFEPGKAVRSGLRGVSGIEPPKIEPDGDD